MGFSAPNDFQDFKRCAKFNYLLPNLWCAYNAATLWSQLFVAL